MIGLLVSVFVASLFGSIHCAGMCGPLSACAGVKTKGSFWSKLSAVSAYQLGRLATYLVIGAAAGLIGGGLNLTGSMLGWQRVATWFAGGLLISIGIMELVRRFGGWSPKLFLPPRLLQFLAKANRAATKLPTIWRAVTVGLLTGLMPCGWLYAFALSAAATGSPFVGMAVMGVFWLGAVPVLAAIGWGSSSLFSRVLHQAPYATAILLIVAGTVTLSYRQPAVASEWNASFSSWSQNDSNGQGEALADDQLEEIGKRLENLDQEKLPCCSAKSTVD